MEAGKAVVLLLACRSTLSRGGQDCVDILNDAVGTLLVALNNRGLVARRIGENDLAAVLGRRERLAARLFDERLPLPLSTALSEVLDENGVPARM